MALPNKAEFVFSEGVIWDQPFFVDLLLVGSYFSHLSQYHYYNPFPLILYKDSFVDRVEGRGTLQLPVQFMTEILQSMPAQCASWLPPIGEQILTQLISLIQGIPHLYLISTFGLTCCIRSFDVFSSFAS